MERKENQMHATFFKLGKLMLFLKQEVSQARKRQYRF